MNKINTITTLFIVTLLVCCSTGQKLNKYNVDPKGITTTGVSAGAYMAGQVQVAFSSTFSGLGQIAGGPYNCAQDTTLAALENCMAIPFINVDFLVDDTKEHASAHQIDSTSNLSKAKVFLFSGTIDTVVLQGVVDAAYQYFLEFTASKNIVYMNDTEAEHAWITNNYGNDCSYFGSPYINNCGIDLAKEMYSLFYGTLKPRGSMIAKNLLTFDQTLYSPKSTGSLSLGSQGYIYVPTACQKGTLCKLTVVFHGCEQTVPDINDVFYTHVGVNEWAETNNIIVVYPQAIRSDIEPFNPKGCFDWWGYTTSDYAFRSGPQMQMIKNIVAAITGRDL